MTPDDMARALAGNFEKEYLTAYLDPCGYWTIGIGHKILPNEQELKRGITKEKMEALFNNDLAYSKNAVNTLIKPVHPLTDGQLVALWDFTFNEGEEALESSTLRKLINIGDMPAAALQFERWDKGRIKDKQGIFRLVELPGLRSRRYCELDLFGGKTIADLQAKRWYQ